MNDFLQQFLIESRELVLEATQGLLLLEKSPRDAERLDTVFRAFHTLKGGAGIVEFAMMEQALHAAETLLMEARSGKRTLNPALVGDCLTSLDRVSRWLDTLEQTGELPPSIEEPSHARAAAQAPQDSAEQPLDRHPGAADSPAQISLPDIVRKVLQEQLTLLDVEGAAGAAGRLASAARTAANALRYCGMDSHADTVTRAARRPSAQGPSSVQGPRSAQGIPGLRDAIAQLLGLPSAAPALRKEPSVRTLRVNAEQIDALVRLTGELTVAKNAVGHTAKLAEANGDSTAALLKDHHGALNRLVAQLQSAVIGMRVLPLRNVFQRFPRVLREMSANLGKTIELKVEGEDTEADKTIVEMLFEPLLHIVRNAIDHGIESAEQRKALGKPPVATILLRASRAGDQVLIEVADDGAGVDVERVRQVAKDRGVAGAEDLEGMADSEVVDLVFAPGFSTAAHVTEMSGRGVGMDAVRAAVERVGGRVSISSRPKTGTTVSFALPFSVLMTQVMTVEAGGQIFGIPLDAVVETVSVTREAFSGVGEARVIVHRNRTIPILDLDSVLNATAEKVRRAENDATVIVASVAGQLVGLQVDHPGERMEIILKPLDGLLSGMPGIAGTTVLGDGRVLLVLDIMRMLQ